MPSDQDYTETFAGDDTDTKYNADDDLERIMERLIKHKLQQQQQHIQDAAEHIEDMQEKKSTLASKNDPKDVSIIVMCE